MGTATSTWRGCGETRVTGKKVPYQNVSYFPEANLREEFLIFSCMWGTSKHASPFVTSECFKSVYFSSLCEINKFSSL